MFRLLLIAGLVTSIAISSCKDSRTSENGSPPPKLQSEEINYSTDDGMKFHGWMVWDSTIHAKRPGVIVVHEWWGHNAYARHRAEMLAELGYTAFAIDMFGDGKTANHPDSAMAFVQQAMATAETTKSRFDKALQLLRHQPTVDPTKIGAIGYCFGGSVVLDMARAGEDLDAVVSFHGGLPTQHPADSGAIKADILVCTGADDPMNPPEYVQNFESEMDAAGAHYRVISYPGAKHAFTNPAADSMGKLFNLPLAYNPSADVSSWKTAKEFLAEAFKK